MEEAEERGVKVAVCQNARYSPASVTINRLVSEGTYGRVSFGLMTKYGWRPGIHVVQDLRASGSSNLYAFHLSFLSVLTTHSRHT